MKTLLLTLILLVSNLSNAQVGHHHSDHPSTHGMLMLGSKKIYLSHLPMFHSPHDYQVILEAEIDPISKAAYLQNLNADKETVYTLVPETFVLPEMVQNPRSFSAQIFKGHFERGGKLIAARVTVKINKVVYFAKFDPTVLQPDLGSYIVFGNSQEFFMAHVITAKPDYDQLVRVNPSAQITELLAKKDHVVVKSAAQNNTAPLERSAKVVVASDKNTLVIDVDAVIYFETGDLSF